MLLILRVTLLQYRTVNVLSTLFSLNWLLLPTLSWTRPERPSGRHAELSDEMSCSGCVSRRCWSPIIVHMPGTRVVRGRNCLRQAPMRAHDGQLSGEAGEDRTFVPSSGSVSDTQLGDVRPHVAVKQREFLLQYVNEVELEHSEHFSKFAPPEVEEAMRETIKSLLGSLPVEYFTMSISSVTENLAQLMFSMMMTGYMFRNAQYRLELQKSVLSTRASLKGAVPRGSIELSEGSPDAVEYVSELESEIEALRAEVEHLRRKSNDSYQRQTELLDYIKSMEPENLRDLTSEAGVDVLDAMNALIKRLLGTDDTCKLASTTSEVTNTELSRMVKWMMVVGYSLRSIEVKFEMEKALSFPEHSKRNIRDGTDL